MKCLKDIIFEKLVINSHQQVDEKLVINKNSELSKYFVPKNKIEFDRYVVEQKQKVGEYGTKTSPVDLSYIDFSELVKNEKNDEILSYYFFDDDTIEYLDMSYCKFEGMTTIDHMFEESQIKEINITGWELYDIDSISGLFLDCIYLENIIGLEALDTSKIKRMSAIFGCCSNLKSIDLSNWDVSNSERLANLFKECGELTDVGDLSNWNLKEVLTMRGMFKECFKLKTIKGIEKWKLPKVKNIASIFLGDKDLNINIDGWNLSDDVTQKEAFDGTNINPSWAK